MQLTHNGPSLSRSLQPGRLKPACLATRTIWNIETLQLASTTLHKKISEALLILPWCAGRSAPLLFSCCKIFSYLLHIHKVNLFNIHGQLSKTKQYYGILSLFLSMITYGAQWLSGRVLDSRPKGRGFEPHRRHCVVVLEHDTFILA